MSDQNIYDNECFFEKYSELRRNGLNYNDLFEQPAIHSLLPDLTGKTVLDLGCGFGKSCMEFIRRGAVKVIGVDISGKMINTARENFAHKDIEYICMSMNDLDMMNDEFDVVYSSLAFHYVENFNMLITNIYNILNDKGILIFSQEHPIITATKGDGYYNLDNEGQEISYVFSDYSSMGLRKVDWFVNDVIIYHRTIGNILTTIANSGFIIKEVSEPFPQPWAIDKMPALKKELIKPNFLMVSATK